MVFLKAPIWGYFFMLGFILAKKGEMKRIFDDKGHSIPVTYLHTKPCYLIDLKKDSNGHLMSVKLGSWAVKTIANPQDGELKKAGIKTPLRFFKEIRIDKKGEFELIEDGKKVGIKIGEVEMFIGDEINPSLFFAVGGMVDVTGTSKGKGFAGVVKRHKFAGGPRTHGQSDRERAPGSIGMGTTPGRVFKGKRMAGRMGGVRSLVKNLPIIESTAEYLVIKGLIPGPKSGLLEVISST